MKERPTEAGLYFAKANGYHWWNLIVLVTGEAPWLSVDRIFDMSMLGNEKSISEWGPRIAEPTTEKR